MRAAGPATLAAAAPTLTRAGEYNHMLDRGARWEMS
jgi:hypothetical protein